MDRLTILIIGGYGVFGGRIVSLLEDDARLTLVVAGRSASKAHAYVESRGDVAAQLENAAFDRDGDISAQLGVLEPDVVVDASGPFQSYGADRYRVVEACIACGVHYLDLADGSDFVDGVAGFDESAKRAGVFVLTGVSSFPVLTAAVVRRLAHDLDRVDSICGGVAPSPFAGVGGNVIRAIASYAGQAVRLRRNGGLKAAYALTESRRFTIAPPGRVPLKSTLFSLVDVPDLRALSQVRPEVRDVWMGAGPVPEILHRALGACAWLVRVGLIPSLSPIAGLMHFSTNRFRWGEHRGGMFVVVEGADSSGDRVNRSWHLLAEGDDGPLIPSMAVVALVRRMLSGASPPSGARAAVNDLELDDYEDLCAERTIYTGVREDDPGLPLYARILGERVSDLPGEIRAMHEVAQPMVAEGVARVERGRSWLGRLVAAIVGFPAAGDEVPVRVEFQPNDEGETWVRTFAGKSFLSRQYPGRGRSERLINERFGPMVFAMALVAMPGRLSLVLRRWSFLGVPLPMWLGPRSDSYETVDDGKFRFHVDISHPLAGRIVRYSGLLNKPRAL